MSLYAAYKEYGAYAVDSSWDVEELIKALKFDLDYARVRALEALGEIGEDRAIGPIVQSLKDDKGVVRRTAARVLVNHFYYPQGKLLKTKEEIKKLINETSDPKTVSHILSAFGENLDIATTAKMLDEEHFRALLEDVFPGLIESDEKIPDLAVKLVSAYRFFEENKLKQIEYCPVTGGNCSKIINIPHENYHSRVFIDTSYDPRYDDFIKGISETLKKSGLSPILAKDRSVTKNLLCHICETIQSCKYGVVNITRQDVSRLDNIFYEFGLMQALSKKCAILKHVDAKIPSDIAGMLYLEYANAGELKKKLEKWIKENVKEKRGKML